MDDAQGGPPGHAPQGKRGAASSLDLVLAASGRENVSQSADFAGECEAADEQGQVFGWHFGR